MMLLKIKCLVTFRDLNIIPRQIKQDEVLEVDENTYERLKNSGGKFEVLDKVIPPPTKAEDA